MDRTDNIYKNTIWKFISTISGSLISFVCRYFFIHYIGDTLLGVNSLFSDVLVLFSFAEMGIGPALTYCLYDPISRHDTKKVQSLLGLYRKMYRGVMIIITLIGIGFIPFLSYVKTDHPLSMLYLYYVFFIVNNVLSYVCAYKKSYVEACQKAYCIQHITLISSLLCNVFQISAIIILRNYVWYLFIMVAFQILSIVWSNYYISKHFPETVFGKVEKISESEWKGICKQIRGLLIQKIGSLGISQTDSLIVSMIVNVVEWGYVSNYNTIRVIANGFLYQIYSSILPSMGNVMATDTKERQKQLFRVYNLFNEWIYYNAFLILALLSTPVIQIVFGEQRTLDIGIVVLIAFNLFFAGLQYPIVGIKEANGLFTVGKWLPMIACVVNLSTSVILVKCLGTIGVFIGTICSSMVIYVQPYLVWKKVYGKGALYFYLTTLKTLGIGVVTFWGLYHFLYTAVWEMWTAHWVVRLVVLGASVVIISNLVFVLFYMWSDSFKECLIRLKKIIPSRWMNLVR